MRKVLLTGLLLCFTASFAFAQEMDYSLSMNGVIIDTQSVAKNKNNLDDFLKTYTKNDALAPDAVAGGYGIFLEDGYMKFDAESNAKIVEFLNKPESTLGVTVKVIVGENDILNLVSIQNR
ncbi:MAG: hypothetical protein PHO03_02560 [Candidatus Omnitrophica bacterium]|nr:hypothetical protein [Candidatus Omnitrophota bacterium]